MTVEWQLIETAPKDGTSILVCTTGMRTPWLAYWKEMTRVPDRWEAPGLGPIRFTATHWMPLPEPPK